MVDKTISKRGHIVIAALQALWFAPFALTMLSLSQLSARPNPTSKTLSRHLINLCVWLLSDMHNHQGDEHS
jgi:hypothetical protein